MLKVREKIEGMLLSEEHVQAFCEMLGGIISSVRKQWRQG